MRIKADEGEIQERQCHVLVINNIIYFFVHASDLYLFNNSGKVLGFLVLIFWWIDR